MFVFTQHQAVEEHTEFLKIKQNTVFIKNTDTFCVSLSLCKRRCDFNVPDLGAESFLHVIRIITCRRVLVFSQ